jgi:ribonuclease P protein component
MVLHYLAERPGQSDREASTVVVPGAPRLGARAGFVVGKAVGNSVVRHRVTRRLRELVRAELHRLPLTADLVVRARPEAGLADSALLRRDLAAGLDRLLPRAGGIG